MRVMTVVGTRPEAIKMIPVMRAIRAEPGLVLISVTTGQHRELLDQVFAAFGETADHDLALMTADQTLPGLTAAVLERMTGIYAETRPDLVLVHGDTTTALAAAMAAFYAGIRIGHVEAGLRSGNLGQPCPEEFNRVTIDRVADLLFAPTEGARARLRGEYNRKARVFVTGNTGIDALLLASEMLDGSPAKREAIAARHPALADPAAQLVLVTGHRRENFGEGFERICDGLIGIGARYDVHILYPVHLNPNVRRIVDRRLRGSANVRLIDPVDYLEMVWLMRRAKLIVTDSGGIQEEAPALGKPVLVLRETTERPEALATEIVRLVGTDPARIAGEAALLLDNAAEYARRARPVFAYGDGKAAGRIAAALTDFAGELGL